MTAGYPAICDASLAAATEMASIRLLENMLARVDPVAVSLKEWGADARVEAALGSGDRNDVRVVRIGGDRFSVRVSNRSEDTLLWELELLERLAEAGFVVHRPIRTRDGRRHVQGLVVFTWLDGRHPTSVADWRCVKETLARLHTVTEAWPQRPGFHTAAELARHRQDADVDLAAMPADVAQLCTRAFALAHGLPTSVVHGDPGAANILINDQGVGFVDWDESRVDARVVDLAWLACDVSSLLSEEEQRVGRAVAQAREVAGAWRPEPEYARRLVANLEATMASID